MADISAGMDRAEKVSMEFDALAMEMTYDVQELRLPPRKAPSLDDAFFVFRKVA